MIAKRAVVLFSLIAALFVAGCGNRDMQRKIQELEVTNAKLAQDLQALRSRANESQDRVQWVLKCLADFGEIKPGMTRAEIDKRLRKEGGFQIGSKNVRYNHPECLYFKINVEFAVKRNPSDQNREVPSPDDKAVSVSKPYMGYATID
jgi:outer membrane murein-binding lipoprotein Lpp